MRTHPGVFSGLLDIHRVEEVQLVVLLDVERLCAEFEDFLQYRYRYRYRTKYGSEAETFAITTRGTRSVRDIIGETFKHWKQRQQSSSI